MSQPAKQSKCFICGQIGHWDNRCPNKGNKGIHKKIAKVFKSTYDPADWEIVSQIDSDFECVSVHSTDSDNSYDIDEKFQNVSLSDNNSENIECTYLFNCFMFSCTISNIKLKKFRDKRPLFILA